MSSTTNAFPQPRSASIESVRTTDVTFAGVVKVKPFCCQILPSLTGSFPLFEIANTTPESEETVKVISGKSGLPPQAKLLITLANQAEYW